MILGDCAPFEVGELLPDFYSYQKPLRVSFTVQISGPLLRLTEIQAQSCYGSTFRARVFMEKQRQ